MVKSFSSECELATDALVNAAGWRGEYRAHPLAGGANNRVYHVEGEGFSGLLKSYFYHENDPRDRLKAEYSFTTFAWNNGVRYVPRPLACDRENRLALYEFLPGRRVAAGEIDDDKVNQAIRFYAALNELRRLPDAQALPLASEACFSFADHLNRVEHRLARLRECERKAPIDVAANLFVRQELSEVWRRVVDNTEQRCAELGLALEAEIAFEDRILSPSDFGFHNALLERPDRLRFIDFEYAGWDDPAKLVCDFFCQPEVPVPFKYFEDFRTRVTNQLSAAAEHRERISILLPVYQIKWCCILLNDFLSVDGARRRFAGTVKDDLERRKEKQLEKVRTALPRVNVTPETKQGAARRR